MSFLESPVRTCAHPSMPGEGTPSLSRAPVSWRRVLVFAVLHGALLGAMYGAAVLNAKGHELEADAYGAGRVEHLGRMTLYPVLGQGATP